MTDTPVPLSGKPALLEQILKDWEAAELPTSDWPAFFQIELAKYGYYVTVMPGW